MATIKASLWPCNKYRKYFYGAQFDVDLHHRDWPFPRPVPVLLWAPEKHPWAPWSTVGRSSSVRPSRLSPSSRALFLQPRSDFKNVLSRLLFNDFYFYRTKTHFFMSWGLTGSLTFLSTMAQGNIGDAFYATIPTEHRISCRWANSKSSI